MKNLKQFVYENRVNLCTFDASKFDHKELGDLFIKLGESLQEFDNAKEFGIEHYKDDDNHFVVDISIRDKSYNTCFSKKVKSK